MQKLYGEAAKKSKAIFIHGAGFDSMPGEYVHVFKKKALLTVTLIHSISTYLSVKKLRTATNVSCGLVTSGYQLKGGMSGGTFGTMLVISKQSRDAAKRAVLQDPYSLSPSGQTRYAHQIPPHS